MIDSSYHSGQWDRLRESKRRTANDAVRNEQRITDFRYIAASVYEAMSPAGIEPTFKV